MTEPFGNDGEIFKFSLFLVLANRIISLSVAVLALGVSAALPKLNITDQPTASELDCGE